MSTEIAAAQQTTNPPPARCSTPGCKSGALSWNNTSGKCRKCRDSEGRSHSKKTNGAQHQPRARDGHAAAAPVSTKSNGHGRGNGNGAQPAEETPDFPQPNTVPKARLAIIRSLGSADADGRVDLLMAAIPSADKAKMLCAWLAGTL